MLLDSISGPTDIRPPITRVETAEYLEGTSSTQRDLQDSINDGLAAMTWHGMVPRALLDEVVTGMVCGNRLGARWERVTSLMTTPPKIRIKPW